MSMTPQQLDQLVEEHFGFEATDDVDGVMATLTKDAEHEVIPSPVGALTDPTRQRAYYQMCWTSAPLADGQPESELRGPGRA
jgi:hypothetical protein